LFLMTLTASLSILTGCSQTVDPVHPPVTDSRFCDVMTERFRYTQAEIDLRTEGGFTKNLAREYRLNLSFDRECQPTGS